jgi:hypothetical protein
MKKSLLFLLALFIGITMMAQVEQYEDVVYLKNGSIIHGMIIEQIPNETIKIKTADRNVFVFEFDQIERITKEEVQAGASTPASPPEKYVGKQNGFEGTVDMYFAIEFEYGEPVLGMDAIAGYRFFPQLFIGAGTGFELFFDGSMMPFFVQVRADFVEAKATPFFYLNAGYALGWVNGEDGSDYGGLMMEPGIGIRINIAKNFGMNLGSSFKFQRAYEYAYYYEPYYYDDDCIDCYYENRVPITLRMFTFKIGFSF